MNLLSTRNHLYRKGAKYLKCYRKKGQGPGDFQTIFRVRPRSQ